jgi:alkanesulfonate monooxygenase SsuD/methylene tetrahydromethanopterin reductase-like flavin-dependent oxidoreductase (luciferase family)
LLLGLGAGGTGFDSAVLGQEPLSPGRRVDRFAEFVELLGEIVAGKATTRWGEFFTAVDARGNPGPVRQPRPPFVIAANGRRTLDLAARHGDGWVTTGPAADTADAWWSGVADLSARFGAALDGAGRPRDAIPRYLNLDSSPVYSMTSVDAFTDAVGRAAALGFTDVVTHWPRATGWYAGDEKVLESVAAQLPRLRHP